MGFWDDVIQVVGTGVGAAVGTVAGAAVPVPGLDVVTASAGAIAGGALGDKVAQELANAIGVGDSSSSDTSSTSTSGNTGAAATAAKAEAQMLKEYNDGVKTLNAKSLSIISEQQQIANTANTAVQTIWQDVLKNPTQAAADLPIITQIMDQQEQYQIELTSQVTALAEQYKSSSSSSGTDSGSGTGSGTDSGTDSGSGTGSGTDSGTDSGSSSGSDGATLDSDTTPTSTDSDDTAGYSGSGISSLLPLMMMSSMIPSMLGGMSRTANSAPASSTSPELASDVTPSGAGSTSRGASASDTGDEGGASKTTTVSDTPTQPASSAKSAGDSAPAGPNNDVKLPDGTTIHAPNAQAAAAVRAALNGASPSDAYQQAGMTLPPPGTPVLNPVAPGDLQAGDVGMWKDHLVMALGNDKVLVSGQVQPESSVGSSPDFLGWMRPTQVSSAQPAASATTAAPVPAAAQPAPALPATPQ